MTNIENLLEKLGWDDGFQIPIANDENKALEEELVNLTIRKTKAKNASDNVGGRLEALKEHFKFVTQENEQTQRLMTTYKQQLEFNNNQFHVTKSSKDSYESHSKNLTKQIRESEDRAEEKKKVLEKGMDKASKLKAEMDWDAEAVKAWEETLKKRDGDIELVKKYNKEDEMWFNELEAKRQHLQSECADMSRKAAKIAAEASNCELIIERSGKVINQQIGERTALMERWKETVKMLQQRDQNIMKVQEQLSATLEVIEKQEEKLEEENTFLKNEKKNNHVVELELQKLNITNSRMRKEIHELHNHVQLLTSELYTHKRQVSNSAQYLENERLKGKHLIHTIEEREMLCGKYQDDIDKLYSKIQEMKGSTANAAERIKKIESMIDDAERLFHIHIADTEKLNTVIFRYDKMILDQRETGKILALDINNAVCNISQLKKHIQSQKTNFDKIKEVVYDMEYRIDDIEKKLYALEGDEKQIDEKSDEKEKEIQELERVLAEHKDVQHVLQNQVDRLQEEMRRLANLIVTDKETLTILQSKCENHLLVFEIGLKHINTAKKSTQQKQVEENMIRLHINQIEKEKKNEELKIISLEKIRLNLNQAMKERQLDINTRKQIIQAKKRNLEEEKGRLRADITLRRLKIEQIQKKYHLALLCLGQRDDGEQFSVSHFKIKFAQEKFLLQQEGDELDQKIKTAEKEIIAMENTLKVLNLTNVSFKNSLTPVKEKGEEVMEMNDLEQELRQVNETLKNCKIELSLKESAMKELQVKFEAIQNSTKICQDKVSKMEEDLLSVKKQELDKEEKLKRAECHLKKVLIKLGNMNMSKFERDFEIRQISDTNGSVLNYLIKMGEVNSEISEAVYKYIMEYNIALPEGPLTPGTSGSSHASLASCASSAPEEDIPKEIMSKITLNLY